MKDIVGVLSAMKLECFIAVLGLAYELPYVPDDSAHREGDILHLSMLENTFCFSMSMMLKSGKHSLAFIFLVFTVTYIKLTTEFENAKAGGSSKSTPKCMNNH